MRLSVRMRPVEEKVNTTLYEPVGDSPPMKNFYLNTEVASALPFDTKDIILTISDEPFAEGEVALAFPPVPFYKAFRSAVRYEHRVARRGGVRRAANTPELPVSLAYVNRAALDEEFIAGRRPIHFGVSAPSEVAAEDEEQPAAADIDTGDESSGVGDESSGVEGLAAFDGFLRESVKSQKEGRLTSRRIWAVWAARCDADPSEDMIADVQFADVARRFRALFGAAAAKNPTRIDGRLQRYWDGYTI